MRRGTIQLSAQFLVMMILTLVVLGVGFGIFYKVLDKSSDLGAEVDQQTKNRINQLLLDGDLAIAPPVLRLQSGKSASAAIGIFNIDGETSTTFDISISSAATEVSTTNPPVIAVLPDIEIGPLARGYARISVDADGSPAGQYVYTVTVTANGETYTGRNPKLIVHVQ